MSTLRPRQLTRPRPPPWSAEAPPGPTPGSSLTIFTAASSDVTVSRACGAQGKKRGEEGAGPGLLRLDAQMYPPPVLPPVLPPRTAHLVNVAIGPGPHTLQQLKAVSRILQRHVPQQRHGPAPDRPAGASCGAGAERRGAARGGAGRGGRAGRGSTEARRPEGRGQARAGPDRGCPSARLARRRRPGCAGKSPSYGRSLGSPPTPFSTRYRCIKFKLQRQRKAHVYSLPHPRFPDETQTCLFFF